MNEREMVREMDDRSPAYDAGYERGTNAGSWVFDGNTSEDAIRRVLQGWDDGDPEILDMQPAPLSGEWAGESIPELSSEYGIDLEDEENADEFENGFSDGFWGEVERSGHAMTDRTPSEEQAACPECQAEPGHHAHLHAGHIWTNVECPAYRTLNGDDCTCGSVAR